MLGALSLALLATAGFVRRELRTREPMLTMRLFASRTFGSATAASFLLFAALYGSVFLLAQFMQVGLGHDALEAGLRLVPWSGTLFVVAPLAGVLADRFGNRPVLTTGLALNAAGLAWIALIAAPGLAYSTLVVPLVVTGVGASMAIPVVQNAVLGAVAAHEVGKASGANTMTQELGGVLGVAILVAVFGAAGGDISAQAFVDGFVAALAVCAALAAGAAVASLAVAAPAQAPAMR